MNTFDYVNTVISLSEFDFTRLSEISEYHGEMSLAVTFGTPKDITHNKKVFCELDFSVGSDTDTMFIHTKSRSMFELKEPVDVESLEIDMQEYCYRYAADELTKRISEITKIQIGRPINIPIPPLE